MKKMGEGKPFTDAAKFKSGDTVEINGLKSALHLNESRGKIVKHVVVDSMEERWMVECYDGRYNIKVVNLTLCAAPVIDEKAADHPAVSEAEAEANKPNMTSSLAAMNIASADNLAMCAACGKGGDGHSMNTCNKCKETKYCNAACKKRHRHKHKEVCKKLHDKALFREPPPQYGECPICCLPLPDSESEMIFQSCCGKLVCNGCMHEMIKEQKRKGKKSTEDLCAFCRNQEPVSDKEDEVIVRLKKLIEKGNAMAFNALAGCYVYGNFGVPQNYAKANELYLKAGEFGLVDGYHSLGVSFANGRGVDYDKERAKYYWELASMGGHVSARRKLALLEKEAGNDVRYYKHLLIGAICGDNDALGAIKQGAIYGFITKDEYENALRACQKRADAMKSDARDEARREYHIS